MSQKESRPTRPVAAALGRRAVVVVVLHSHRWDHHGPGAVAPLGDHGGGAQSRHHGRQRWAVVTVTVAEVAVGDVAGGRGGGALHRLTAAAVPVVLGDAGQAEAIKQD